MHLRENQKGNIDPLMIPLVVSVILVVGLAGFGIWSYMGYLDQKDNTDQKIAAAVAEAEATQADKLEADFAEREKSPTKTFISSASIGSIEITYPKTWSAYVEQNESGPKPLNAFFHPKYVPSDGTLYALRLYVDESNYSKSVTDFDKSIEKGLVKSKPIRINGITGMRFDGQIDKDFVGSMVIFPLRDKTVKIWTESSDIFEKDFNNIILKNLTFEP
jgi:type II secretory pathway pseudopilin PulG